MLPMPQQQMGQPQNSPWLQMQQQNAPALMPEQMANPMYAEASAAPTPSLWEMVQHLAQNDQQRKVNEAMKKPEAGKAAEYSKGFNSASGTGHYKVFANPQQRGK